MITEIGSAVDFLSNILVNGNVSKNQVDTFRECLKDYLWRHYQNHWFPEKPNKGSGYRCLRINHKMDPLISKAGTTCGLSQTALFTLLPSELTMWVDPDEVSYRIGEDGSIGVLLSDEESSSDSDDDQQDQSQSPVLSEQDSEPELEQAPSPTDMKYFQSCKDQFYATNESLNFDRPFDRYGYLSNMSTFVAS